NTSGWGRVNLGNSVIIPGSTADAGFGEGGPLQQDAEDTIMIKNPGNKSDAGPNTMGLGLNFKITLVWTDPPASTLQNDLDLIVIASDGSERHGNMGISDSFDRVNNVEQVTWTN